MKTCKECGTELTGHASRCAPDHLAKHAAACRAWRDALRQRRFPPELRASLLADLASGTPLGEACRARGFSASALQSALRARSEADFRAQLDAALMEGRDPALPHGTVGGYRRGCRCPECRAVHEEARRDGRDEGRLFSWNTREIQARKARHARRENG